MKLMSVVTVDKDLLLKITKNYFLMNSFNNSYVFTYNCLKSSIIATPKFALQINKGVAQDDLLSCDIAPKFSSFKSYVY